MLKKSLFEKESIKDFIFCLSSFIFTFISYLIFKPLYSVIRNGVVAQSYGVILIFILICIFIYFYKTKKLNERRIILFLLTLSFIIRLTYMLNTPYDCRQYDTIVSNNDGHEGYALTLFTSFKLPASNSYQFYHPPLNAFIQAIFMHISEPILSIFPKKYDLSNFHTLYQSCQILSVLYVTITSLFAYKILKEFNLSFKSRCLGFIFFAFFPRFIQLSAQLNNDMLCIMFCIIALYYSIRFYKEQTFKNIILESLMIGLAMSTKINGAIICIAPAFIFLKILINEINTKNKKRIQELVIKYVVFLLICAPLGLWFQVYAKLRFNQNLGYVFDGLNDALSTKDHNFFERFLLIINFKEIFKNIYCLPFEDYSLFNYILKSALFGEFNYWQGEAFAILAILLNYIFIFTFVALLIKYLLNSKKEDFESKFFAFSILISQIIMMIYFNIKMPYGCTMDFRYIVVILLPIAILISKSNDKLEEIKKTKLLFVTKIIIIGLIISSNLFYLTCI